MIIYRIKANLHNINLFKNIAHYLKNGVYIYDKPNFVRLNMYGLKYWYKSIFVFSFKKNELITSGQLYERDYKIVIIGNNNAFYLYNKEPIYFNYKNKISHYISLLNYPHINITFYDNLITMKSSIAKGKQFRNDEIHFKLNYKLIFNSYSLSIKEKKKIQINNYDYIIYYCVQHGDFHDLNIFWDGNNPTMIDLDEIKPRPLFYDLIYYCDKVNQYNFYSWFCNSDLQKDIHNFLISNNLENYDEKVDLDLYLASFAYDWLKDIKDDCPLNVLNWHMSWIVNFDFSELPLTKSILIKYANKLKLLNFKI